MSLAIASVFEGLTVTGSINVDDDRLLANVQSAIRRGHPQVWPTAPNPHRVCIVGGGPSLADTVDALRALWYDGAKIVALNGAYQWCLDHHLRPSAQIILDARPSNARFIGPPVPGCRYYLCSQCAPEVWDAVEGREFVGIFHDPTEGPVKDALDAYYLGQWHGIAGGTTVGTRAIGLLRTLGFLRMDLFGLDSCWLGGAHHAYPQPENIGDRRHTLTIHPTGAPEKARTFTVSGWHIKQLEDLILLIRSNGDKFLLNIHGDGLLAYALRSHADVQWTTELKG